MGCSINSLRDKEVINVCDGRRLGYIFDVEINAALGSVTAIVVLFDCRVFGFGKCEELIIPWDKYSASGRTQCLSASAPSFTKNSPAKTKRKNKFALMTGINDDTDAAVGTVFRFLYIILSMLFTGEFEHIIEHTGFVVARKCLESVFVVFVFGKAALRAVYVIICFFCFSAA